MQIPRLKRSGEVGLHDYRGLNIRLGERAGLVYEYDWVVRKNPQAQAIRTRSRELQFAGLAVALGDEEKAMIAQVASAKELTDAKGKVKDKSAELAKQQLAEQKLYLETTKAAQDYAAKLQSIASNERIKLIESRVKLEIAQAVADAQKFEFALKSLSATVESSGDVISSIFSAFGDIEGFFGLEKLELVQEQLKIENKIREQALDLQRQLIESQINLNQSRTASLQRGNALIQIDGKGLQPHLEAFMWEILKTIQTRVNADGLELWDAWSSGGTVTRLIQGCFTVDAEVTR